MALLLISMHDYESTRGEFVMSSWLNPIRNPYAYFTCSVPRSHQPCIMIPHTSDVYVSGVNKTLLGLRELYYLHPSAKWYWITTDDAFINSHYLRKKIEGLNHSTPILAGGVLLPPIECPNTGRTTPILGGGGGQVISNQLIKETAHLIEPWLVNNWRAESLLGRGRSGGDVALGCFFAQQGYPVTHLPGFSYSNPKDDRDEPGFFDPSHIDFHEERNNWHYVRGVELLYADVFFGLQMIDRMERNHQLGALATYAREMVVERFYIGNWSASRPRSAQ
jgi:hypothetical protein